MDDAPGSATIHPERDARQSGTLRHLAGSHAIRAPVDALRGRMDERGSIRLASLPIGWTMRTDRFRRRACRPGTFADRLASPERCARILRDARQSRSAPVVTRWETFGVRLVIPVQHQSLTALDPWSPEPGSGVRPSLSNGASSGRSASGAPAPHRAS